MDVLRWLLGVHNLDHLPGCAWDGVQLVDLLDLYKLDADKCSNNCSYRSCNNDYRGGDGGVPLDVVVLAHVAVVQLCVRWAAKHAGCSAH